MVPIDPDLYEHDRPTLDPEADEPAYSRRTVRLTVVHHPNPRWIGATWSSELDQDTETVVVGRSAPLFESPDGGRFALDDPHLSRRMLRLRPLGGAVEVVRVANSKPVGIDGKLLRRSARLSLERLDRGPVMLEMAGRVLLCMDRASTDSAADHGLVGLGPGVRALRAAIDEHAVLDVPVVVFGEPGSGKGAVARALHQASGRANGPAVELDAHALHISTAEAAHVQDVYPQTAIPQAFKMARGGTLIIDRLEDAEHHAQAQLLAQLKGMMLASDDAWNIGLITTIQAEPEELVRSGRVAHSLLDRLQVGLLSVPPLRDRREDIALLLHHFLDQVFEQRGGWPALASAGVPTPWLGLPLLGDLLAHAFPGNVRELSNLAFQIAVHSQHQPTASLPNALRHRIRTEAGAAPLLEGDRRAGRAPVRSPQRLSASRVRTALKRYRWNVTAAARDLGVARNTLLAFIDRTPGFRRIKDIPEREIRDALDLGGGDEQAAADELEVSLHGLRLRLPELGDGA